MSVWELKIKMILKKRNYLLGAGVIGGEGVVTKINIIIFFQARNSAVLEIDIILEIILLVSLSFSLGGFV